ncbi:MAG: SLBB domain-containing protein, partial [Spirochaetales bacterium]|nr:SLBB domain-containing protein [Spirochaetales bacterium]
IPVETDYSLNLGIIGKVNGDGLTFPQLKQKIEQKFSSAYPQGTPSLTINSLGRFQVLITGEVPQIRMATAWGLSRLNEIIFNNIGPYSSIRDIKIKDKKGKIKTYDLFEGIFQGNIDQNPYVRPGDTIIISKRGKKIELRGEIYRPGNYQILKDDTISGIIQQYGGDFTENANRNQLRIEKTVNSTVQLFDYKEIAEKQADSYVLDGDVIIIEQEKKTTPVLYIEGAIREIGEETVGPTGEDEAVTGMHNLIIQPFLIGDTLYDVMNKIKDSITSNADLVNSYLVKNTEQEIIPLNLQELLYNSNFSYDQVIESFDRIIIPTKAMFVIVNGDVRNPGNYHYIPQKKYKYYIRLAGGTINGNLEVNTILITGYNGNIKDFEDDIELSDTIFVKHASVIVSGAVSTPGEYPYFPGKTYSYYINLAGGIDNTRNDGEVKIRDSENKSKKKSEIINPGDSIYIPPSSFIYNVERFMTIITTALTIVVSSFILYDRFSGQ